MVSPKNILITGASSGIGAALARYYAAPDIVLGLTGRNEERLAQITQDCEAKGAIVIPILCDVCDRNTMAAMVSAFDAQHPVDLLIANAGISGGMGNGGESSAQARTIFEINFNGILNTLEPLLPTMQQRGKGQIALMSSLASFNGWPGAPAYSASKGAIRFYGEALREKLAGNGIKVNIICPGFIKTPMTDINPYPMPFLMDAEKAARIIAMGLAKNKGRIAFPWPTYLIAGLIGILPFWLSSLFLGKLPDKPQTTA